MIADTAAVSGSAEPKARIFISYSRKDIAFADRLDAALQVRGFEALIDRTEIYSFEDWWKRIQALIGKDTIIFVLSPDAVDSDICRKEVAFPASLNKRFAPIVCRPADVSKAPIELSRLNFLVLKMSLALKRMRTNLRAHCRPTSNGSESTRMGIRRRLQ